MRPLLQGSRDEDQPLSLGVTRSVLLAYIRDVVMIPPRSRDDCMWLRWVEPYRFTSLLDFASAQTGSPHDTALLGFTSGMDSFSLPGVTGREWFSNIDMSGILPNGNVDYILASITQT